MNVTARATSAKSDVDSMDASEATVAALIENGIDTLYALPGLHNDPLCDAAYKRGNDLRVLHARHEQGTAYMALGAALSTGKPQAFAAVPGPGFLNTTAALLTAEGTCAPVLGLLGQIPQRDIDRNYGHLHEIRDQIGMAGHVAKYARRIRSAHEAPRLVGDAISEMISTRPGPAVLECAMDIWATRAPVSMAEAQARKAKYHLDMDQVEQAAKIAASARKPMIIVGGGALDASDEVRGLAEFLQAPVLSYRRGRGVISTEHPLAINLPQGHHLWPEVDVVIAIGTRLFIQEQQWGMDKDLKVLRIDSDPEAPNRHRAPDASMIGDAKDYTASLLEVLKATSTPTRTCAFDLEGQHAWLDQRIQSLEPQVGYLRAIRNALPDDGIFVDEVTQVGFASRLLFPVYSPRTFISPGYQDNLGWGYGTALGVKAANPDKPVVGIAGDGGFMYQVGELATAVQHNIGLVMVVFDNAMFGNVKRIQQERYGNRVIAADLASPDFAAMAETYGAEGYRVSSPDELEKELSTALAKNAPALIQVKCGEMPSAWDMLLMPKIRG
ncbi:thiamine pyrophosphate-binding protein [Psychromarinibacter sp. C21-152]|uniref:Thiamine pyrophosphate-binding protein n=1 Tax=Psychromarinibacter sediminicola TaxID=3033385 RepID=A0AAE3T835_9RHOB|nr:thiamine pyrophosphate-dependent enzyme [Psychromarinibacter sediminicola]MDF0600980.1 thiamine pyrophosphate-binding protein [Psychromarinibacter sediminicola]